jgi:hypothetical protein
LYTEHIDGGNVEDNTDKYICDLCNGEVNDEKSIFFPHHPYGWCGANEISDISCPLGTAFFFSFHYPQINFPETKIEGFGEGEVTSLQTSFLLSNPLISGFFFCNALSHTNLSQERKREGGKDSFSLKFMPI